MHTYRRLYPPIPKLFSSFVQDKARNSAIIKISISIRETQYSAVPVISRTLAEDAARRANFGQVARGGATAGGGGGVGGGATPASRSNLPNGMNNERIRGSRGGDGEKCFRRKLVG